MRNLQSERGASSLNTFFLILAAVAVVGAGVLIFQVAGGGEAAVAPVPVEIDPAELARVQGVSVGREDAPVVVYEFADFQCPGCGQFAMFVTPLIKERLVEPGLVRYVYYDFPLSMHAHAFLAARAARCAEEQGRFWEYHDVLYARQASWSVLSNATDFFVDLAEEVDLEVDAFEACLRSDRYAEEVTRSLRLGESLGVRGTPTLFINGQRLDQIPSFSELEQIVHEAAGSAAQPAQPAQPADSASAAGSAAAL